ncbi:MAG: endo alpha-1,4 polygalactosaminidase, partial [Actinomycetaceae bacterium]
PPSGGFDYQLGGPYDPPDGTEIVVRDSTAEPADGAYGVCYVNGFQSQPGESEDWGDLLLTGDDGPVADPDWPDEFLLDTSIEVNREAIAGRLIAVVEGCADAGYEAVEYDNLDSFLRSEGLLTPDDNLALARLLIEAAHGAGLAAGQKNAPELADAGAAAGFDFAVTEECGVFDECADYLAAYGVVLDVEYTGVAEFGELCESGVLPPQAVRRDVGLSTPGSSEYVFERCPG